MVIERMKEEIAQRSNKPKGIIVTIALMNELKKIMKLRKKRFVLLVFQA